MSDSIPVEMCPHLPRPDGPHSVVRIRRAKLGESGRRVAVCEQCARAVDKALPEQR